MLEDFALAPLEHFFSFMPSRHTCLTVVLISVALNLPTDPVSATSEIKEVSVTGSGGSINDATINGLLQAIQQISGLEIQAVEQVQTDFRKWTDGKKEQVSASESFGSEVQRRSRGLVNSYNVLSSRMIEDGHWEVDLSVRVPVYKALGTGKARAAHMRSMAVLPFRTTQSTYRIGTSSERAGEVSRDLNQQLTNQLAQSRRFRLVEREYVAEVLKEKNFILSADVPFEELARIGQSLGADYLLIGTIASAEVRDLTERFGDFVTTATRGAYAVDYRVIETAPQEIRWAGTVSGSFDLSDTRINSTSGRQKLFSQAASKIAGEILEVIYPLKVLELQGHDSVVLTQGGVRVQASSVYRVHGPSRRIIDPDTRVPTKVMGAPVATIEIVSVYPKYSVGKIVDGDLKAIVVGATVMPVSRESGPAAAKPKVRKLPAASGEAPVNW